MKISNKAICLFRKYLSYVFASWMIFLLSACASQDNEPSGFTKRFNESLGTPTDSMALYIAQSRFAYENCLLPDTKSNNKFYNVGVNNALQVGFYKKYHPKFVEAEKNYHSFFTNLWNDMSSTTKNNFCSEYFRDVEWAKTTNILRLAGNQDRFRVFFSPISEEAMRRAQVGNIILGGLALTSTAAGLNQINKGNLQASKDLSTYSRTFTHLMNDPLVIENMPCIEYLPFFTGSLDPEIHDYSTYYSIRNCKPE